MVRPSCNTFCQRLFCCQRTCFVANTCCVSRRPTFCQRLFCCQRTCFVANTCCVSRRPTDCEPHLAQSHGRGLVRGLFPLRPVLGHRLQVRLRAAVPYSLLPNQPCRAGISVSSSGPRTRSSRSMSCTVMRAVSLLACLLAYPLMPACKALRAWLGVPPT